MCNMALYAHWVRDSSPSTPPSLRPPLGSIPSSRSALSVSRPPVSVRKLRMPLGGGVKTRLSLWMPPPQGPFPTGGERRRISDGMWRSS